MNENRLQELFSDPRVRRAAGHSPPSPIEVPRTVNNTPAAPMEYWVAVHIVCWLRRWRGTQHVVVGRIWKFFESRAQWEADIDIRVGHDGVFEQFKVLVVRIPNTHYQWQLTIVRWVNRVETAVWTAYGASMGNDQLHTIGTIPTRGHAVPPGMVGY